MEKNDIIALSAILLVVFCCFFLIWATGPDDDPDDGNVNISGGEMPEMSADPYLSEDNEDEEKTPAPSVLGHALPLDDRELRIWMAGYFGHDEYVKMFKEEPPEIGPDLLSGDNNLPLSDREARIQIADRYGRDVYVKLFGEEPPETGADPELAEDNEDGKKIPTPSVMREPLSLYSQEERIRIVELYGRDMYVYMFGEEPPETDTDPDLSEDNENEEKTRRCLIQDGLMTTDRSQMIEKAVKKTDEN